jgi:uncharacterized Fe-S cluster protein YjdI
MPSEIRKRYSGDGIAVLWQPALCIHCGVCAKGLPTVFQPKDRPWIKMDGAPAKEIARQVAECPSGAISLIEP